MKKFIKWTLTILCVVTPFLLLLSFTGIFGMPYNRIGFSRMWSYFPWAFVIAIILCLAVVIVVIKNRQDEDPWGINLLDMQWWAKLIFLAVVAALYFYNWKSDMEATIDRENATRVVLPGNTDNNPKDSLLRAIDTPFVAKKPESTVPPMANSLVSLVEKKYQSGLEKKQQQRDSLAEVLELERGLRVTDSINKQKRDAQNEQCFNITKSIDSLKGLIITERKERKKFVVKQTNDCDCSSGVVVIVNGKKQ